MQNKLISKTVILAGAAALVLSAESFTVRFFTESAAQPVVSLDNTAKVSFAADKTTVTDKDGKTTDVNNTTFGYMLFSASSSVADIDATSEIGLRFDGTAIRTAGEVDAIEVAAISGIVVARAAGSDICSLDGVAPGVYVVRAIKGAQTDVMRIFKKF